MQSLFRGKQQVGGDGASASLVYSFHPLLAGVLVHPSTPVTPALFTFVSQFNPSPPPLTAPQHHVFCLLPLYDSHETFLFCYNCIIVVLLSTLLYFTIYYGPGHISIKVSATDCDKVINIQKLNKHRIQCAIVSCGIRISNN